MRTSRILGMMCALALATGVQTMAQEIPTDPKLLQQQLDEFKKQKEFLDAQAARDVAAKQAADAKKALDDAQKAPSASAEAVAQAKAAKDVADARKAQSDAELAAFKAALGEVPSSGVTGTVTAGE